MIIKAKLKGYEAGFNYCQSLNDNLKPLPFPSCPYDSYDTDNWLSWRDGMVLACNEAVKLFGAYEMLARASGVYPLDVRVLQYD